MVKKYTKEEVLSFLKENPIMSAAMCGTDRPVSTVLLYAVDDDFTLNFASKVGTYKVKALSVNPQMSVTIWKNNEMEVQISGKAEEISEPDQVSLLLDKLALSVKKVDDFWAPVLRLRGDYICFAMKPSWLRVLDLSSNSISESESGFTEYDLTNQK